MLDRIISEACALDDSLNGRREVHVLNTAKDGDSDASKPMVAPIVSKLLLTASDIRSITSTITSYAISDAFSVARGSLDVTKALSNRSELSYPSMHAPEWTKVGYEHRTDEVQRLLQLELNDNILHAIEKMNLEQLVSVYGDFFHHV